jgi:GNAT superfamily N-acetyltransferase
METDTGASAGTAAPPCQLVEWDSEHFGVPIGRVTAAALTPASADAIDRWCLDQGIRCLYFLADARDAESARVAFEYGYRFVDVRITAARSYQGVAELPSYGPAGLTVREADEEDLDFALDLAVRSHRASRFYFDRNFPTERCDALYRLWVERGFRDPERMVRIPIVDGERAGYHVLAPLGPERVSSGELLAVDDRQRGKGVAIGMMVSALRYFAGRGALTHRSVRSHRTIGSARYFERLGMLTETVEVWHHKWFEPGAGA